MKNRNAIRINYYRAIDTDIIRILLRCKRRLLLKALINNDNNIIDDVNK